MPSDENALTAVRTVGSFTELTACMERAKVPMGVSAMKRVFAFFPVFALVIALAMPVQAAPPPAPFFQGFEKNTSGWFDSSQGFDGTITREPSGFVDSGYADGIQSAAGHWHARITGDQPCDPETPPVPDCFGVFTRWGGYSSVFPAGGYKTQADIYLDVNWSIGKHDWRFDWDSSINDNNGNFLQDYVFNVGTNPSGAGGFFVNASTNATRSGAFPENPCPSPGPTTPGNTCRTPALITTSGWYTFRHKFTNEAGFLRVDFDIFPLGSSVPVASWTIRPGHAIAAVGGNRYGWFVIDEIPQLPIDNTLRTGLCHTGDGDGDVEGKNGKAHFHHHGQQCEGQEAAEQGDVEASDPGSGADFKSTSVTAETFAVAEDSQTLTMVGTGTDNGLPVGFTMVVVDNNGALPGVFTLTLTDGYAVTGSLVDGALQVT